MWVAVFTEIARPSPMRSLVRSLVLLGLVAATAAIAPADAHTIGASRLRPHLLLRGGEVGPAPSRQLRTTARLQLLLSGAIYGTYPVLLRVRASTEP